MHRMGKMHRMWLRRLNHQPHNNLLHILLQVIVFESIDVAARFGSESRTGADEGAEEGEAGFEGHVALGLGSDAGGEVGDEVFVDGWLVLRWMFCCQEKCWHFLPKVIHNREMLLGVEVL